MPAKYQRQLKCAKNKSFFLFGPRGTGKTTWLIDNFPKAVYIDLLKAGNYNLLLARPERLEEFIPNDFSDWVIIDEVQKIPELLNEVHRLIEDKKYKFILTGSNARKLKKEGVNLLAGRALTYYAHPLTVKELGEDFDLRKSLKFGNMPAVYGEGNEKEYLESYVATYLNQEVFQEGLTRNLSAFSRFLEVASFSQGSVLNVSEISRECAINRKVAENYFSILEDLLMAYFLPPFTKKSKRKNIVKHNKFYYFDAGIYRTIRPAGPLDSPEEIDGIGLETLILQELTAANDYNGLGYKIYFWKTAGGAEVDFVLYGEKGMIAMEVKRKSNISNKDLSGLRLFLKDYPGAKAFLLYGGERKSYYDKITALPVEYFLKNIAEILS